VHNGSKLLTGNLGINRSYLCNAQYFVDPCRDLSTPAKAYKE